MDTLFEHWELIVLAFTIGGGIAVWRVEAKSFARMVATEFDRSRQESQERHAAIIESIRELSDQSRRAGQHNAAEHKGLLDAISAENQVHSDIAVALAKITTRLEIMQKEKP